VAYFFKARTSEPEKQPLLGNAHTQKEGVCEETRYDTYSRCYGTVK
jgi:hypothetical protein